ncbi:unnamed protein product, partial [marine sediment metagenome]
GYYTIPIRTPAFKRESTEAAALMCWLNVILGYTR